MNARLAYVCLRCAEIQDRAKRGCCEACGSERIVSVQAALDKAQLREVSTPGPCGKHFTCNCD